MRTVAARDTGVYFHLAELLVRVGEDAQARALLRIVEHSVHGGPMADAARELLRSLDQDSS